MAKPNEGSARQYSVVTWLTGSLGWYASVASMSAKFCWANNAKPDDFCQFLSEFKLEVPNPLNTRQTKRFDMADLNLRKLARTIGEPVGLVRSMSRSLFVVDSALLSSLKFANDREGDALYICPICIATGHHSIFHELDWLDYCVHHVNVPLVRVPGAAAGASAKQRRFDTQFSAALQRLWQEAGSEDSKWPAPLTSDSPIKSQRALPAKVQRELKAYARPAADRKWIIWGRSGRFVMPRILNDKGRVAKWRNVIAKEVGQESTFRLNLEMSQDAANLILERDWTWADRNERSNARLLSCVAAGEFPAWRHTIENAFSRLRTGHEQCVGEFKALLCGSLSPWRNALGCTPACALNAMGSPVCPRLITLDLLSHAVQPHSFSAGVLSSPCWPYPGIGRYCAGQHTPRVLEPLPAPHHWGCPEYPVTWSWQGDEGSVSAFLGRRVFIADPLRCFSQYLDALLEIKVRHLEAAVISFEERLREGEFVGNDGAEIWAAMAQVYGELGPTVCTSLTETGLEVQVWSPHEWNAAPHTSNGHPQAQRGGLGTQIREFLAGSRVDRVRCRAIDHLPPLIA
jgi:hypothetical protein